MTEIPSEFPESASDFHQVDLKPKEKILVEEEFEDPISFTQTNDVEPDNYKNPNKIPVQNLVINKTESQINSEDYLQIIEDSGEIKPYVKFVVIKTPYKCDITLPSLDYFNFESDLDGVKNSHSISIHNSKSDVWHILHSNEQNINDGLSNVTIDRGVHMRAYATKDGWIIM